MAEYGTGTGFFIPFGMARMYTLLRRETQTLILQQSGTHTRHKGIGRVVGWNHIAWESVQGVAPRELGFVQSLKELRIECKNTSSELHTLPRAGLFDVHARSCRRVLRIDVLLAFMNDSQSGKPHSLQ